MSNAGVVAVLRGAQEYVAHCAGNCDPDYLKMVRAIDAVADLIAAAQRTRDNFRCVLSVNCNCDDEFIDSQTAEIDAALAACKPRS